MAEFSLTIEAAVRGYHAYMEQWEAAADTTLYFKLELGERDDSLDFAADDDLLESETSIRGNHFRQKLEYDSILFRRVPNN